MIMTVMAAVMPVPSTDEELVARSKTGDMDSFNQLVKRWERPIFALAYRTLGREEDARDVTQESFLRASRAPAVPRARSRGRRTRGPAGALSPRIPRAVRLQRRRQVFVLALPDRAQSVPRLDAERTARAACRGARGRRCRAA